MDPSGSMMVHEATEGYEGAKIAQQLGINIGPATRTDKDNPNSFYNQSHNRATPQLVNPRQEFFERDGTKTKSFTTTTHRVNWYIYRNNGKKIIQTLAEDELLNK